MNKEQAHSKKVHEQRRDHSLVHYVTVKLTIFQEALKGRTNNIGKFYCTEEGGGRKPQALVIRLLHNKKMLFIIKLR